jgi:hypothetical protein
VYTSKYLLLFQHPLPSKQAYLQFLIHNNRKKKRIRKKKNEKEKEKRKKKKRKIPICGIPTKANKIKFTVSYTTIRLCANILRKNGSIT